jgi:predicted dinucleotide-binding enzyme
MGNFEGSNRSSRSCISTEKDDADPRAGSASPGAKLVKAFNTLLAAALAASGEMSSTPWSQATSVCWASDS